MRECPHVAGWKTKVRNKKQKNTHTERVRIRAVLTNGSTVGMAGGLARLPRWEIWSLASSKISRRQECSIHPKKKTLFNKWLGDFYFIIFFCCKYLGKKGRRKKSSKVGTRGRSRSQSWWCRTVTDHPSVELQSDPTSWAAAFGLCGSFSLLWLSQFLLSLSLSQVKQLHLIDT